MTAMPFQTDQVFIAGEWRAARGRETLVLENPSDGTELTRIARGGAEDVAAAVTAAQAALRRCLGTA